MTIYTLGPPRLSRKFAKTPEEIKQLALERHWGTTCKPPDEVEVVVDMFALLVTVRDPTPWATRVGEERTVYKILEYARVVR